MAAYAMAEAFMSTGVGASLILIALKVGITAKTVAVVWSYLVTSILSIATEQVGEHFACLCTYLLVVESYSWWKLIIDNCSYSRRGLFWR